MSRKHDWTSLMSEMDRYVPDHIIDRGCEYYEQGLVEEVRIEQPWIRAIVYGGLQREGASINWRAKWLKLYFGDQGFFIRRSIFQQIGGFPPVALMEDWILSQKAKQAGRLVLLSEPIMTSSRRFRKKRIQSSGNDRSRLPRAAPILSAFIKSPPRYRHLSHSGTHTGERNDD